MTAILTFESTSARASSLVALHSSLNETQRASMPDCRDLLRSAIALSVAGMDAYFTDRFAESLVRFLKKRGATKGMIDLLSSAGLDAKAALEMLAMQRPYRRIRTIIESSLSEYTTQKQRVIDELFVVYGVKDLCRNAEGLSKRKKLLNSVNNAVLRRHSIVHGGDLNSHGKARLISEETAKRFIKDIDLFVHSAEDLLVKSLKI